MDYPKLYREFTPAGTYPIIGNILPPSYEDHILNNKSLFRLENICACAIVKSEKSCQILSNVPNHLNETLWKAYLRDEYYNNPIATDDFCCQLNLHELLYHWPYEEFDLKHVMPELPESIECFSPKYYDVFENQGPFYHNEKQLLQFYENVVKAISSAFTNSFLDPFHEQHNHDIKIRKINLSGFHTYDLSSLVENIRYYKPIPKPQDAKLLEMIVDVYIHAGVYIDGVENNLNELYHCHSKYYHSIRFHFQHVSLTGPYKINNFKGLLERIVDGGKKSLGLGYCRSGVNENTMIEEILKTDENQSSNIVALQLGSKWESLNILQYLRRLVHLDLSGNNLHGKLEGLKHMQRGLLYLRLSHCYLKSIDLDQLIGSCHLETLLELNLNYNQFSYDTNSSNYNLITLCQSLRNILMLELPNCNIESWYTPQIILLIDSLNMLPTIVHLDLSGNKFSTYIISVHMKTLKENPSLRYLKLSLPTEMIESEGHDAFCNNINEEMNDLRGQLMCIDISVHLSDMDTLHGYHNHFQEHQEILD